MPIRTPLKGRGTTTDPSFIKTESNRIKSATVRATGPPVSHLGVIGITPAPGYRPTVGLRPAMPQNDAGTRIDPNVSSATARGAMRAATAAAEPPLLPPGTREVS